MLCDTSHTVSRNNWFNRLGRDTAEGDLKVIDGVLFLAHAHNCLNYSIVLIGKMVVPLGWDPSCLNHQGAL